MNKLFSSLALVTLSATAHAQAVMAPRLLPSSNASTFGSGIDVEGDRMVVGAPTATLATSPFVQGGVVCILERQSNGQWVETSRISASNAAAGDGFGVSVALEGERLLVGAPFTDHSGFTDAGTVYVFELVGGVWTEMTSLISSSPMTHFGAGGFGWSLSLSGDRVLMGDIEAVEIFDRVSATSWTSTVRLTPPPVTPAEIDAFGSSVSLDGDRALVGTPRRDFVSGSTVDDAGAVFVYEHAGGGVWNLTTTLVDPSPSAFGFFGYQVVLDGSRALIGAPQNASGNGSAYIFELASGVWSSVGSITASDGSLGAFFGGNGDLEGDRALVAAQGHDNFTGKLYFFERQVSGTWTERVALERSTGSNNEGFALGVALDGSIGVDGYRIVSGASSQSTGSQFGAAYVVDGPLHAGVNDISLSAGGTQDLLVRAGDSYAGHIFVVVGGTSGIFPGIVDTPSGLTIPINFDAYTALVLGGSAPITPYFGVLDGQGAAALAFTLPSGSNPALANQVWHHAVFVIDPTTFVGVLPSNAVAVRLRP